MKSSVVSGPLSVHATRRFSVFSGEEESGTQQSGTQQSGTQWPDTRTRLSEFFEDWFVPYYARSHAQRRWRRTLAETRTWVGKFLQLIGDLPLCSITLADCEQFQKRAAVLPKNIHLGPTYAVQRAARRTSSPRIIRRYRHWRPADEDLAPRTLQKGLGALQRVFDAAGPRSRGQKHTADERGLFGLDEDGRPRPAPWFDDVEVGPSGFATDMFTVEEISRILRAAVHARQPQLPGIAPADWWRALILFLYNSGVRIGTALALRRSWVGKNLLGDVFLAVPASADKKGKPRLDVLNSYALAAIESLPTSELIFPCPHNGKHVLALLRELERHAGLPAERQLGFHGFRKANGTELWKIDSEAAQSNLGHGDRRTTVNHYVAAEALVRSKAARELPALEGLPQPTSF